VDSYRSFLTCSAFEGVPHAILGSAAHPRKPIHPSAWKTRSPKFVSSLASVEYRSPLSKAQRAHRAVVAVTEEARARGDYLGGPLIILPAG
jgi:hypothetical protein